MMKTLRLFAFLLGLAAPAAATGAYMLGPTINQSSGTVSQSMAGTYNLAAASGTISSPTIILNGQKGGVYFPNGPVYDVRNYGANNAYNANVSPTTSEAAFKSAIAAASPWSTVYFPCGDYAAVGMIEVTKPIWLRAENPSCVQIYGLTSGTTDFFFIHDVNGVMMSGFNVSSDSSSAVFSATVHLRNVEDSRFSDMRVGGGSAHWWVEAPQSDNFTNIMSNYNFQFFTVPAGNGGPEATYGWLVTDYTPTNQFTLNVNNWDNIWETYVSTGFYAWSKYGYAYGGGGDEDGAYNKLNSVLMEADDIQLHFGEMIGPWKITASDFENTGSSVIIENMGLVSIEDTSFGSYVNLIGTNQGVSFKNVDFEATLNISSSSFHTNLENWRGPAAFINDQSVGSTISNGWMDNTNDNTYMLSSTRAAQVGVGTITPASAMDVNGQIRSTNYIAPASGAGLELGYTAGMGYLYSINRTTGLQQGVTVLASTQTFGTQSNNPAMTLVNAGNLGIGTTTPQATLDVVGTASGSGIGLPAMTTTQVQASSPKRAGVLIYNTTIGGYLGVCVSTGTTIEGYARAASGAACQ